MAITFRQLEIFVAVAESNQVTRASKDLELTQSAVSMALAELENQLGGPLFDRHGRSLLLNDRGRYLLPHAKTLLHQAAEIETVLTGQQDTVAGVLHIVASTTLGIYVMPYLMGAFMRHFPEAHVDMLVVNTMQAKDLVAGGHADLGFIEGDANTEELTTTAWFADEFGVIVSPQDPLAQQSAFRIPEDLKKTKWVIREEGSGTAEVFLKRLGRHAQALKIVTRAGHTEAIKKAVEAGVGAACLSKLTVAREAGQGWLKLLDLEGIDKYRQFWIIQRQDKIVTRLMAEFLRFCEGLIQKQLASHTADSPWILHEILTKKAEDFWD